VQIPPIRLYLIASQTALDTHIGQLAIDERLHRRSP
jgi:hypothetical protein